MPQRLPTMLMQAGFSDVSVEIETDKAYKFMGAMSPPARFNDCTEMNALRPVLARVLGGEAAADRFLADWFGHFDSPETSTILPLWFVSGTVPN